MRRCCLQLRLELVLDIHLDPRGEDGVQEPVQGAAGREVECEPSDEVGEDSNQGLGGPIALLLRRLLRRLSSLGDGAGDELRDDDEDGEGAVDEGVVPSERRSAVLPVLQQPRSVLPHSNIVRRQSSHHWSFQGGEEEERLLEHAVLPEVEEGAIERDEDGELDQDGEAASKRVDLLLSEEHAGPHVDEVGVVLVLFLDPVDLRLDRLHLELSGVHLVVEGIRQALDQQHDCGDRPAVVACYIMELEDRRPEQSHPHRPEVRELDGRELWKREGGKGGKVQRLGEASTRYTRGDLGDVDGVSSSSSGIGQVHEGMMDLRCDEPNVVLKQIGSIMH
mmetsp:Transcript_21178/g.47739  ORF Transcript_21178/g.47739 Transcript_21178/m.47739 type:complete len:335 (-) Transcript_21178:228-1232(-)